MDEMDLTMFEAAMRPRTTVVPFERLAARYYHAFEATRDVHSAMAAVNELSPEPITFEAFMDRLSKAA